MTAECIARNGVAGRSRTSRPATAATSSMAGTWAAPGRDRPPEQQRPAVDERPAAEAVLRPQLRVVPPPDGVQVAQRQLVQGGVPGEVAQALGRRAVTGHPAVHPGQPGLVVAGLVVRVRPRMRGVTGARLLGQRAAGQLHRLVVAALLLPDEREQSGEPPVVAVRRDRALHDRPRLLGHLGHAGERDRRARPSESSRASRG